jgi:hypothetical protein
VAVRRSLSPSESEEFCGLTAIDTSVGGTVKVTPWLATPFTVTITGPVVAADGTAVPMVVTFQLVGVADLPLNEMVLEPWLAPKPDPLIATVVPAAPDVGERLLITGVTVKATPLLAVPLTLTTTGPVVAAAGTVATIDPVFQLVAVAATPLKVIVLDP